MRLIWFMKEHLYEVYEEQAFVRTSVCYHGTVCVSLSKIKSFQCGLSFGGKYISFLEYSWRKLSRFSTSGVNEVQRQFVIFF